MLLKVEDLRTHLDTKDGVVKAVDGVSFEIGRGETFCLVGESGSGKSVTALSVMQLLPQDISRNPSGRVLFEYRHQNDEVEQVDMLKLPEKKREEIRGLRMTMIFQEPMSSLNPVVTVGDQIIETLSLHNPEMSYEEARTRTLSALEQVQLPNAAQRIDDYPHRLSGGQRQRVMIAMAMVCEPDLLIADEPTTALDVTVQAEILKLMKDLQRRKGTAILFITHDFGVVSQIADRLAVMKEGIIVESGKTEDVLTTPEHPYTRQLVAALPENLKHERRKTEEIDVKQGPTLIDIKDLRVHFPVRKGLMRRVVDHVRAVDGVSLTIPEGQIMALVGESGCGKTTLGRALLRLIEPTEGAIQFNSKDIATLDRREFQPYRRLLQVVFQDPVSSLNPRLTVATMLTEPMAVHGIGESQDERLDMANKILDRVQMPAGSLWRYPHEFSGGQRQRIGIARALVLNPRFIVCDEVTSALDVSVQAEVLKLLLELRKEQQLTLLFITHNIGVVEFMADTVAVMHQGKIVEQGPTDVITGSPSHPYTQQLLAAVPRVNTFS